MIFVCGDIHGTLDRGKLSSRNWPEGKQLTKNDYLIVLGDFGLIWDGTKTNKETRAIEYYNCKSWTTLFIDGNHENFARLFGYKFKDVKMFGSFVRKISDSVFYLHRGHIYNIEEKTFFTFGGADSHDKEHRRIGISWWPEEIPNYKEMDLGIDNLNKACNKVDFILTHTCSKESLSKLNRIVDYSYRSKYDRTLTNFFSWIEREINFKQWHFGHFHNDIQLDSKHFLHYNNKPMRIV